MKPSDRVALHRADELTRPIKLSPWVIAGGAIVTGGMFAMLGYGVGRNSGSKPPDVPPSRLAMIAPTLGGSGAALNRQIAMTPDGAAVVFVTQLDEGDAIAYQRLDSDEPVVIRGTTGTQSVQIAPDGRSVVGAGTESGRRVFRRFPLRGGNPSVLPSGIDAQQVFEARDGSMWFTAPNGGLYRASAGGEVGAVRPDLQGMRLQQMLENGTRALVVRARAGSTAGPGLAIDVRTGEETQIVAEPIVEMRVEADHLVYVREDGTMWAAPFDTKSLESTAPPVQVGSGVALTGTGIAQFAVARNGNVAYVPEEPRSLVLVQKNGTLRSATSERRNYNSPRFSPDGRRVSVDFADPDGRDVWLLAIGDQTLSRATFARDAHDATWSVDGEHITYTSFRTGSLGIYRTRPGSTAPADSLFSSHLLAYTGSWLRDGSGLVTTGANVSAQTGTDVVFVANGGRGPIQPVIVNAFSAAFPAVSRDGKWLAWVSNKSGRDEVYVRPWQRNGDEVLVSQNGGSEPVWDPTGRSLYYRRTSARRSDLIEATVMTGPSFRVSSRSTLFAITDMTTAANHAGYDISPDGRAFVMVRRSPASRIMVLQNLPAIVRDARGEAAARR